MSRNPVFNGNKLKLGTFCTNGRGTTHSLAPEANQLNWQGALEVAREVDRAGYEAVVPFARWKGYVQGKPGHVSGEVLDPYTFAAAIAQATTQVGVFVTSHAPTIHPIVAAKQTATIDIISNGRLALNVVGGWNRPELEMFGAPLREHDQRYDYLAEWLDVLKQLWSSTEEFDHHGEFFDVIGGFSNPKPVQRPHPPIMNAGHSGRGRRFACEHANLCFIGIQSESPGSIRNEVDAYKRVAREEFGRDVQVWAHTYVVQRDTQKGADDFVEYYAVEHQDRESIDGLIGLSVPEVKDMPREAWEAVRTRYAAGYGGFPLVGTAERICEKLSMLSDAGLDGVLLTWIDFVDGARRFNRDVLPLLERAGLRKPVAGG
ncbi:MULTISPECIES: LLM class flavin-dependent oxidoreductase [unclassified Sphingomonas]|uniref:LLM class flavin-dependent oxidoreductase n=1 Tax=unclassified Sphingomonas TaxID=196159 RepID=UPI0006F514F7|nr:MULTISPECIES: LLM class flavin-dependent oxidoreductase [unclassified Sphingomonas]KQX23248.1 alkanesulfonate monooxygenase [Sphingomonas sp. Root1294]KQY68096.1 alkanesulfonate monooxygenase [Sphingomonas sp. Root50]KRB90988.1 alkanesulfonate monooxygenase [Sphingomonas sp. Root720]